MASAMLTSAAPGESSNAAVHLREAAPSDAAGIHAVLTATLPDVIKDAQAWLARWQWACWDNPFRGDRPAGWVVVQGHRVVGHLGAVYLPLRIGGQSILGAIGADYCVLPEALANGGMLLGLQLAEAFFASAAVTGCLPLATTANAKTGAVFGRFGCRPVSWTKEYWRAPAEPAQEIRACLGGASRMVRRLQTGRLAQPVSKLLRGVCTMLHRRPAVPVPHGCELVETADLHTWAAALSRLDAQHPCSLGVERSAEYLTWRYAEHPEKERLHLVLLNDRQGSLCGAAIISLDERLDRKVAQIDEIIAPPDQPGTVKALLCAALRYAVDRGAGALITQTGRLSLRSLYWEVGCTSGARSAPAVLIPASSPLVPAAGELLAQPGDALEFWHGCMF